ncbi:Endoribonuclease L-PSP [Rhodomicrobium vannielii ATCC 17100]|uniref:Endoribonuclease L-PSP n=1 Tax=Rhodomicrobium vannielii (strain ATCC 17100 / DSM 162 / LMG 4299 / NCIMB 10020 / ATH 3.1.1) TaxID=648757 RepID=E3I0M4_RHOVT|nr:Rid family hydrolase [Rhodomicrobium vannielii]ADP70034.1 Endoribonuclease L-PSP [Rhodomicrobium vannielii ATCC 17100]
MLKVIARDGVSFKRFCGDDGDEEYQIVILPPGHLTFEAQLHHVQAAYDDVQRSLGLDLGSAVFRRIFLSDALNQMALVKDSDLAANRRDNPVAVSIVQQPPLPGAKIALLAYHIDSRTPMTKTRLAARHVLVTRNGRRHLWSAGLGAHPADLEPSAAEQTRAIFATLADMLRGLDGSLAQNCMRTWIYLRNADVFYQGMVTARRELFESAGLTAETHYIASTGIEGGSPNRHDVISMDALSLLDLKPGQVSYLNDFDMLCATKDYGVTFERGTKIAFADRAHLYISGTASIDHAGRVLHPGDVCRQLDRAIANVDALLRSGGAAREDMQHLIVYLRDASDYPRVSGMLRESFPDVPTVVVHGPVCRPEWLVEIEGVAAVGRENNPVLPAF